MNKDEWISTNSQLPKQNEVVDTKIDDNNGLRNNQQLKFRNNLWWFPDGSMYVYYTPTHWKATQTASWDNTIDRQ